MSVCLPSLFVFSRATLDGHGAGRLARRIKRFVMALNESKKYCVSKRGPFFPSSNAFRFLKRMQNKGKFSMKLRPQLHPHYETRLLSARKISSRSRRTSRFIARYISASNYRCTRLRALGSKKGGRPMSLPPPRHMARSSRCWRYGHLVIFSVKDTLPSSG